MTTTTPTPTQMPPRIDATTLVERLSGPDAVTVVDVRTPAEFETARIAGSLNVPLPFVEGHAGAVAERLHRDVVLVCASGTRAADAQRRLAGAGATRLSVLDGGVAAVEAAGGAVERGRPRWGLERQVRLVAGSVVLGSIAASVAVPQARFLAGAIGAGLTFSALSDTCAMGRVLSALPYNRGPEDVTPGDVLARLPAPPAASA